MAYIVELQPSPYECWLAPWSGDPGRTLLERNAKRYPSLRAAKAALARARKYSPFKDARIVEVEK